MPRNPYSRLWVYELDGSVEAPSPGSRPGFLGCWIEAGCAFLFFDRPAEETARELAGGVGLRQLHEMTYRDWKGGQAIEPFRAGRFTIRPPWIDRPGDRSAEDLEILLDPGVVFGSGNHPTTRHCLAALSELAGRDGLSGRAIDLGCGTGILSLAAAALGAQVTAVDLNPLCCHVTRRNADLNRLADRIEVIRGDAVDSAARPGGLVLANLQAEVIEGFAGAGGFRGREHLILSGLTRSRLNDVLSLTEQHGFRLTAKWVDQFTWFTLHLTRADSRGEA